MSLNCLEGMTLGMLTISKDAMASVGTHRQHLKQPVFTQKEAVMLCLQTPQGSLNCKTLGSEFACADLLVQSCDVLRHEIQIMFVVVYMPKPKLVDTSVYICMCVHM